MLGKHATNNIAESSFSSLTLQLQYSTRNNMVHVAAVTDIQNNGFLSVKGNSGYVY